MTLIQCEICGKKIKCSWWISLLAVLEVVRCSICVERYDQFGHKRERRIRSKEEPDMEVW